jgi:hypothetical protein
LHNAAMTARVYAGDDRHGIDPAGGGVMQISQPRDLGPLVFVVGLFVILFVVTLTVGAPQR